MPRVLVTIDSSQVHGVARDFRRAAWFFGPLTEKALDAMAKKQLAALRAAAPSQQRKDKRYAGKFRNSFSIERMPGVRSIVTSQPDKATFILGGTKPHVIPLYPRHKQALYWPGIRGDRPVLEVNHPGTQPNNFIDPALIDFEYIVDFNIVLPIKLLIVSTAAAIGTLITPIAGAIEWAAED